MPPQTKRQKEVLDIITRFIKNRGFKPSYQQIARELGVNSKGGIAKHINALEKLGCITRKRENGTFILELRAEAAVNEFIARIEWLDVPKDEKLTEFWEFEPLFVPKFLLGFYNDERLCAFRVTDDSMMEEHICDGDVVLIEKRAYARDGDTVVALIDGKDAILQKYYRIGAKIEFRPANPHFESKIFSADKIEIKGTFHSLLRPAT